MTRLAAWLRLMLGAIALAGLIALAAPALAQQQGQETSTSLTRGRASSFNPRGGCGIISTK